MAKKTKKVKSVASAKEQPQARKSLKPLKFKVAGKKVYEVTCADYRAWVDAPASITDCDQRICIIRHASTCADCLRFALKLLAELPEETGKELIADHPDDHKQPKPSLPHKRKPKN